MRLLPVAVEKPWGRLRLPDGFPDTGGRRIGEIIHQDPRPEKPPLLVKHLFTTEPLSIQVHPDDATARELGFASGKTEAWLVLAADPGACIGIGTRSPLDAEALAAAAADGTLEALLEWHPVQAGDSFLVPAGTVHAIGAGVALLEVQQNSDVTFRLFDYGRPRPLQVEAAVRAAEARPYDLALHTHWAGGDLLLAACPSFSMTGLSGPATHVAAEGALLLAAVSGAPRCNGVALAIGAVEAADGGATLELGPGDRLVVVQPQG
jgi:mannose-6-phosphate isomerase